MGYMYGNEYHKFMANISIVKLKVRRGSDTQRKTIVLDQGEIGFTLDTRRLFVGDGSTFGGRSVGAKNIGPFNNNSSLGPTDSPGMQIGDIGYADSRLFMLTSTNYNDSLSGYAYIGTVPDDTLIKFDSNNKLTIDTGQFDSTFFKSEFFGTGLLSATGGVVNVNLNTTYLELSGPSNKISPVADSITEREISTTALSSGLVGGNNVPIKVDINHDQFEFNLDNKLNFKGVGNTTIPATSWAGTGGANLGNGLSLNSSNNLQADLRSVDTSNLVVADGQVSTAGFTTDLDVKELPMIETQKGLVKTISTSIFDVVTGTSLKSPTAGGVIPVGTILPHAAAFGATVPNGYLLANGSTLSRKKPGTTVNRELFDVIGTSYGAPDSNTFSLPNLTGGVLPSVLYGAGQLAPVAGDFTGSQKFVDGDGTADGAILSGFGVNFIIKSESDAVNSLFNGAPDSVTMDAASIQPTLLGSRQVYNGTTSAGANIELSSAGFITFNNGGSVRNEESDSSYDRFAIPIFNY